MIQRARAVLIGIGLVALCSTDSSGLDLGGRTEIASASAPSSAAVFGSLELPLRFEENAGQWDEHVRFVARGAGPGLVLTDEGASIELRSGGKSATVTMKLQGAASVTPHGEHQLTGTTNYFLGNDPTRWRTGVAGFERVRTKAPLPGIDWVWRGGKRGPEYDVVLARGVSPASVAISLSGCDSIEVRKDGALEIATAAGPLVQFPPRVLQGKRGLRSWYRKLGAHDVGFMVEGYDDSEELLIDPVLTYGTYVGGGASDQGAQIAVDGSGQVYFVGTTSSTNYPVQSALYASKGVGTDVVVTKMAAGGASLVYSTYLGGSGDDTGLALALDASGNAYVGGTTYSSNFPTASAYQSSTGGAMDGFVAKLNATGSTLVYSTYLGGSNIDTTTGIAVDGAGQAYVCGSSRSTNYPVASAYQASVAGTYDAVVTKLGASGSTLVYSTYLGGIGNDSAAAIAIDTSGEAFVVGMTVSGGFPTASPFQSSNKGSGDAFVTKFNSSGSALMYSTFLGGTGGDGADGIAIDSAGNAYVAGSTTSTNFPTASPLQGSNGGGEDAFVTKLNASGSALTYSTYLGGSGNDAAYSLAIDSSGQAHFAGRTLSANFPLQSAYQPYGAGGDDAFFAKLAASGTSLVYSSYFGASGDEQAQGVAIDGAGNLFLCGTTSSTDLPTRGAYQSTSGGGQDILVATFSTTVFTLSPGTTALAPNAPQAFTAAGGSGGFTYAFKTNGSGGFLNGSTGAYTAGTSANTVDILQVTDSAGDVTTAKVTIGPGITISPGSAAPVVKGAVNFGAAGGNGIYTWSIPTNASGASISSSTGAYTAGTVGNVIDTVKCSDSLGNFATVNVAVGPPVSITPSAPTVTPLGSASFAATGGSGAGYAWSFSANNSGATINGSTGAYKAGPTGNVLDTVLVTDSFLNTATAAVTVGPALTISPTSTNVALKGSATFSASAGMGPYTFSLLQNASGATISSSGAYAAGVTPNVKDVVKVVDSLGASATADVNVGPGVSITPATPATTPSGTIAFSASGGSGAGYAWSLTANASGGTIDPGTGAYKSGPTGKVSDTVAVLDSLGNAASVNVSVGGGIAINPPSASIPPKGSVSFGVSGGSGTGYVYSLSSSPSGGTINVQGGYTAGPTGDVTDTVRVVDSIGNSATATVQVGPGLATTPPNASAMPGGKVTFSVGGGAGSGYVWSLKQSPSGGTIDAQAGSYAAGAVGGVSDVVQVTDVLGNTATASIAVGPGAAVPPPAPADSSGGCGCRTSASSPSAAGYVAVGLALLGLLLRRRSRRAK